ncbi:hypothetical protein C0995_012583 [Termitomyces sp. Mi166|nr:hypothetical protein C0995_012583 [Termitomyces sp. Mi166\
MKFARYLDDTQTPEWKKAYIDYRGLKKCITVIRKAHEGLADSSGSEEGGDTVLHGAALGASPQTTDGSPHRGLSAESPSEQAPVESLPHETVPQARRFSFVTRFRRASGLEDGGNVEGSREEPESPLVSLEAALQKSFDTNPRDESRTLRPSPQHAVSSDHRALDSSGPTSSKIMPAAGNHFATGNRLLYPGSFTSARGRATSLSISIRHSANRSTINPMEHLPLNELLLQLDSVEKAFFTALDDQLDKIDSFYSTRETEMMAHTRALHEQLDELEGHKELVKLRMKHTLPAVVPNRHQRYESASLEKEKTRREGSVDADIERTVGKEKQHSPVRHTGLSTDPEDYLFAKKKLKKAVLEHYRQVSLRMYSRFDADYLLQRFRSIAELPLQILNLTGFRKALKKFEKTTKIKAQRQYMFEKVERASFASGKNVHEMMVDMESLYAVRFYRLENEHLGNMDQYRVTHEVPLPYSFEHTHVENVDNDDDDDDRVFELAARAKDERHRAVVLIGNLILEKDAIAFRSSFPLSSVVERITRIQDEIMMRPDANHEEVQEIEVWEPPNAFHDASNLDYEKEIQQDASDDAFWEETEDDDSEGERQWNAAMNSEEFQYRMIKMLVELGDDPCNEEWVPPRLKRRIRRELKKEDQGSLSQP